MAREKFPFGDKMIGGQDIIQIGGVDHKLCTYDDHWDISPLSDFKACTSSAARSGYNSWCTDCTRRDERNKRKIAKRAPVIDLLRANPTPRTAPANRDEELAALRKGFRDQRVEIRLLTEQVGALSEKIDKMIDIWGG